MKFEVGDQVERITPNNNPEMVGDLIIKRVYPTVERATGKAVVYLKFEGRYGLYDEANFVLKPKKGDKT